MSMMGLVVLLVTGFLVYYLIRYPIRSFKLLFAGVLLMDLGSAVYVGLFYGCYIYRRKNECWRCSILCG